MDELVKAALKKWPNVPHCHGWLALDARGQWHMRDERAQAAGPFPQVKGSRVQHEKLREFIERNYDTDGQGAWYFQNGPQRVYVDLEFTPWVWRVQGREQGFSVHSHTGLAATPSAAWLDEQGRLYLETPLGPGLVHSLDVLAASEALEQGAWPGVAALQELSWDGLRQRWGLQCRPRPRPAAAP